jgi:hypothetical protein
MRREAKGKTKAGTLTSVLSRRGRGSETSEKTNISFYKRILVIIGCR